MTLCHRRMAILRPDAAFRHIKLSKSRPDSHGYSVQGTEYFPAPPCGPGTRTDQICANSSLKPLSYQACKAQEAPRPVRMSRSTRFPTFVLTPGVRRGSRSRCQDALSVKVHTGLSRCCECPGKGKRGGTSTRLPRQSRLTAMNTPLHPPREVGD